MRFAEPQLLWLLLLSPLLALAGYAAYRRRRRALERFAGGPSAAERFTEEVSRHRRALKLLLVHGGLVALCVALARPQWGARQETVTRRGADVMIVIDVSLSMAAEDLVPSRLAHAQHAAARLIEQRAGDRIGLVSFAGQAALNCPLTVDHAAAAMFLEALDVMEPALPGSAIAPALETAARALGASEGPAHTERSRAIVLFSDGEDHEGGLESTLAALRRTGTPVYVVGCGTARGAPIPLRDGGGMLSGYKKDRAGRVVTTRLDEAALERIALETEGRYYVATPTEVEVGEIAQALAAMEAGEVGALVRTRYEERFQWPLFLGWLALAIESVLGERRMARRAAR
jgi:Ca-activated chloride channel family protein